MKHNGDVIDLATGDIVDLVTTHLIDLETIDSCHVNVVDRSRSEVERAALEAAGALASGDYAGPLVCVVVPTRNEAPNVGPLIDRLTAVISPLRGEILSSTIALTTHPT